jgi:hypothetical protein
MTDEIKIEAQQEEAVAFDDELRDEALDRQAEAASCAHGITRNCSAPPAPRS